MTEHLLQFKNEFLGANTWAQRKDGIPLYLLDQLSAEEKLLAEDALIKAAQLNDTWPIIGLGYLRSQKALPTLYLLLPKSEDITRITIAHTIFIINKDPLMASIVLKETAKISNWSKLIEVIYMLPDFQNEQTLAQLHTLEKHPDFLVSYHAKRALAM